MKRKQRLFDALGIVTTQANNARERLAFLEKRKKNILDELDTIKNHNTKKREVRLRTTLRQGDTGGEGVLAPSPLSKHFFSPNQPQQKYLPLTSGVWA